MAVKQRSGRTVFLVNGTFVAVLLAILAVVAIVIRPPSPPGIAAFAPQAQKPINKAPEGQAAQLGAGPGGRCAAGQQCSKPPTTDPPSSKQPSITDDPPKGVPPNNMCQVWPDGSVTQTFDPQSPPCISEWPEADKGNGGSTYQGVTATEIRVTMSAATVPEAEDKKYLEELIQFINGTYQLYGRRLVLKLHNGPAASSPNLAHAGAQAALATEPFAVVADFNEYPALNRELAANKTLSVTPGRHITSNVLLGNAPYIWSYEPPDDVALRNLGAFACESLNGKRARFSTEHATEKRKFGIVVHDYNHGDNVDPASLQAELQSRCGVNAKLYKIKPQEDDDKETTHQQQATAMKRDGVTTVLTLTSCCNEDLEEGAKETNWHPEWVYYGKQSQYPGVGQSGRQTTQDNSKFGLAPTNKIALQGDFGPYKQAAPNNAKAASAPLYHALAVLAAGIQMAGPKLTPTTFAQGLHATTFPNPGAGADPYYQATVDFPGSETWMIRDFGVWWTDVTKVAANKTYGLCFVDQGRRWNLGSWMDIESKIKNGRC